MADFIDIRGARVNNLKNVSLRIPRDKFVVVAGVSGSGKSSLAFDTLYAEGQRRYVESLSSYARQFLGRMAKPECDFIEGLPPAIAIEQKTISRNPRSTVGTQTEIYEYLRLLYARIGRTYSPVSGQEVKKHTVDDVVECMKGFSDGTRFAVMAPLHAHRDRSPYSQLEMMVQQGYARVYYKGDFHRIDDLLDDADIKALDAEGTDFPEESPVYLVVDRGLPTRARRLSMRGTASAGLCFCPRSWSTTSQHASKPTA